MTSDESAEPIFFNIAEALGADQSTSVQCFTIYVPNKDRIGSTLADQPRWIEEAIHLLCEINGGATAMPPVDGAWRNDDGAIIRENPVLVYSFVRTDAFRSALPKIREFLHRMGREMNQGEIAAEFDGNFYLIRRYDEGRGESE